MQVFLFRWKIRYASKDSMQLSVNSSVSRPLHAIIWKLLTGYVAWIDKPSAKNSVLADILESLGAVFYVKTNIPQTLMV
jgi:hypothetical protein